MWLEELLRNAGWTVACILLALGVLVGVFIIRDIVGIIMAWRKKDE